jgi:phage terminase large subunit-like protein
MRVGAQTPRLSHVPAFTRNDAAEDVIVMARVAGMPLDPWQEWVVRNSLGELDDDRWAAFEAALIVPRQCGKSALIEALILAALFVWREQTVIYSAHLFATAQETFSASVADRELRVRRRGRQGLHGQRQRVDHPEERMPGQVHGSQPWRRPWLLR